MALAQGKKKSQAHVLALPFPFQGHITPLLDLCRKLAAEGVVVSFINIPHYHSRLAPSLQPLLDREPLPIRLLSLSDEYPPPPDLRKHGSLQLCLRHISESMSKEVEDVMQSLLKQDPSLPLTCLLADVRMPFAQCLADKFSISWIAFWTQSAASFSYQAALSEGFRHPTDELAIVDCIPGVPPHTVSDAPSMYRREVVGDFLLDFAMKGFSQLKAGALGVVLNTFESLEPEAMEALRTHGWNIFPVGPLLPLAFFDKSASPIKASSQDMEEKHMCLKWLDACEPASVLYISFGTVVCLQGAEFEELALGIEGSERSFLWSLRPDMVAGNRSSFIEAFKERTKHKGLVVPWVPQLEVLSHASVGGFLTHCGWNSTLESMCRGVPMIGQPGFVGDQKLNMMCLVRSWKVCLAMDGEVLRGKVEQSVRALFTGPEAGELRSSAEKLQSAAACAVAPNGSSSSNLKLVFNLLYKKVRSLHQVEHGMSMNEECFSAVVI